MGTVDKNKLNNYLTYEQPILINPPIPSLKVKTAAFMKKVKIVFNCLLNLWDYKQILQKNVLQTIFFQRSLICFCTESEIELAINAYHARVEVLQ